jgi:hypothetical protein
MHIIDLRSPREKYESLDQVVNSDMLTTLVKRSLEQVSSPKAGAQSPEVNEGHQIWAMHGDRWMRIGGSNGGQLWH